MFRLLLLLCAYKYESIAGVSAGRALLDHSVTSHHSIAAKLRASVRSWERYTSPRLPTDDIGQRRSDFAPQMFLQCENPPTRSPDFGLRAAAAGLKPLAAVRPLRQPKITTSFHGSPRTYQTRIHESPQNFKQIFTWVHEVPFTQKIYQENRWTCRSVCQRALSVQCPHPHTHAKAHTYTHTRARTHIHPHHTHAHRHTHTHTDKSSTTN